MYVPLNLADLDAEACHALGTFLITCYKGNKFAKRWGLLTRQYSLRLRADTGEILTFRVWRENV